MKNIYLVCLLLMFLKQGETKAQNSLEKTLSTEGGEVVYTRVDEAVERTLDDQVVLTKQWFDLQDFSHELITEEDIKRDIIRGRGKVMALWGPNDFDQYYKEIKFDIEIVLKMDRYQYRFDHFVVKDNQQEVQLEIYKSDDRKGTRYNPFFYQRIDKEMQKLIDELQLLLNP